MTKHLKVFKILSILIFLISISIMAKNITVTYNQAKLGLVLQSLSKLTGIKLITSAELAEKPISAYLEDVSSEEAVDSILKANGLYREKISGTDIYMVKVSGETVSPLKSETFFLQYAKAEDLGKVLSTLISSNGQMVIDSRTNSITIRETPELFEDIRKIIISLDKTVPQVAIEAILVEMATDSLKYLGIKWNVEGSWFGPAIDTSFPWEESYSREIVSPRRGTMTTATQSPQFTLGTLSFAELTANLKILEDKGQANILANPRITTLNDSPATIKITKNMAVAPKITESMEGGRITTEYEYRDVGVSLKVVPHVNAEGVIILDVEPTVSSATQSSVFKDAVDTNERTAKTKVMIKSGETLVIGGLLRQDTIEKKSKVPVLGDIFPFLFSRKDKQKGKTDLVMFLIPRIITGEEAKVIAEQEKKRMEEQEKKNEER
ncbi:MAG: hypothetical protein N3D17_02350 [bacterium]|nr:hypothetical protein [bacterium]